jgi:hypothetical protein
MGNPLQLVCRLTFEWYKFFWTTIGAILLGIALFGMGSDKKTTLS